MYALFIAAALSTSIEARADDERDYQVDVLTDIPAEINLEEPRWTFTKSVRVELARSDTLRLETTIPLDRAEEPRLTLGVAKKLSRNWSVDIRLWTTL